MFLLWGFAKNLFWNLFLVPTQLYSSFTLLLGILNVCSLKYNQILFGQFFNTHFPISFTVQRQNTQLWTPLVITLQLFSLGVHRWLETLYLENYRFQQMFWRGTPGRCASLRFKRGNLVAIHNKNTTLLILIIKDELSPTPKHQLGYATDYFIKLYGHTDSYLQV